MRTAQLLPLIMLIVGLAAAPIGASTAAPQQPPGDGCGDVDPGVQCGPGNGRRTAGGGDKVPHDGWPRVTGILWKGVPDRRGVG